MDPFSYFLAKFLQITWDNLISILKINVKIKDLQVMIVRQCDYVKIWYEFVHNSASFIDVLCRNEFYVVTGSTLIHNFIAESNGAIG